MLLLPVLIVAAVTGGGSGSSQPSAIAIADIPANYLALYQQAALTYQLPWELLAAVGKVECDHGRLRDPACTQHGFENEAGAGGPMQFLKSTWSVYGVDSDGDRVADRWNPADAIAGAANYLTASGAPADVERALYAYNHSRTYFSQVTAWIARYQAAAAQAATVDLALLPDLTDQAALAHAVLVEPNIELRPNARADVVAGRVDGRVLADLLALGQRFQLAGVGPFVSGHAHDVHGTNRPSNHAFGRAVDIGAINNELVDASNDAAREALLTLAALPAPLRPDELGSPFADVTAAGAFSDADHHDHLHLGYDQ
jgi:hypothetical protein